LVFTAFVPAMNKGVCLFDMVYFFNAEILFLICRVQSINGCPDLVFITAGIIGLKTEKYVIEERLESADIAGLILHTAFMKLIVFRSGT